MTKVLNFGLKIKGVVGRVAHATSSDPATPQNLKRAPSGSCNQSQNNRINYEFHEDLHNSFLFA